MDAPDPDPTFGAIAGEARRLVAGEVRLRVQGLGDEAVLVVEPVGLAPYPSSQLQRALQVFCDGEGLPPRFLVASSTQPG